MPTSAAASAPVLSRPHGARARRTLSGCATTRAPLPPPPLVVAAGLVVVEGVLLLGYGVLEAAHIESARAAMGVTTAAFFVAARRGC